METVCCKWILVYVQQEHAAGETVVEVGQINRHRGHAITAMSVVQLLHFCVEMECLRTHIPTVLHAAAQEVALFCLIIVDC